ncbi:phage head completion protein [Sphingomonas sanxanigenens]|uniref:phage head completion protein n=1 Tax=Sphingomonas sanxanigenens TaxID=397260 RepID=UPI0004B42797|nr:head-tail adaptor protein [Sphingomonas sanxanigenens]
MNNGRRNRLIRVERATITTNNYNEEVQTWGPLVSAWARVIFAKGTERREAAQEQAQAAATFIVLANSDTAGISVEDRIVFDGSNWNVTSNIPSEEFNAEREIEAVRDVG